MNKYLKITEVINESELQSVRIIRNECKQFMTRNNQDITEEQQSLWYRNLDRKNNLLFIFQKGDGDVLHPIGYGFNRIENNSVLLTGGLSEPERGRGYGKILFTFLLGHATSFRMPICLEVLKSNTNAKKLYENIGFLTTNEEQHVIKMEYRK